jgi:hypothetical protein
MIKRAPGGGRKPKGQFSQLSSTLTIRIPDDMRRQLEEEASARNESLAQRLMWHLRQSFNREQEKERDPALQALLFLIAQLVEHMTVAILEPHKDVRSLSRSRWRKDLFLFRAFKIAVGKLLDAMEEPPGPLRPLPPVEHPPDLNPKLDKLFEEVRKSPEAFADWHFSTIWQILLAAPDQPRLMRSFPDALEYLEAQHGRKGALEITSLLDQQRLGFIKAKKTLKVETKSKAKGQKP